MSSSQQQQQLEAGIAAMENQRATLGDAVVNASVAALRTQLAALRAGTDLAGDEAQALRQVTILFLDVVGSTSLAQQLDPEEVSAVMDGALARGTAIVLARGGKVLKYAGDSILAVFGADEAAEDDAERAVRCGLALLELGKAVGAEVRAPAATAVSSVRVGIHTGAVLLGGGVDNEGTIRGSAVNIAARMEQTRARRRPAHQPRHLSPRCAASSTSTRRQPLTVKGIDEPVRSYLVAARQAARFSGRHARHRRRGHAHDRPRRRARSVAGRVQAPLVAERRARRASPSWRGRRRQEPTAVRVRDMDRDAVPRRSSSFAAAPRRRRRASPSACCATSSPGASRSPTTTTSTRRGQARSGHHPAVLPDDGADLAEGHAHVLGQLIGIELRRQPPPRAASSTTPRQIRNRALHAPRKLLRRVVPRDGKPVVLQLEDLHWADDESLDFLNYLAAGRPRCRAADPVISTRPTLFERRSDWTACRGIAPAHRPAAHSTSDGEPDARRRAAARSCRAHPGGTA